jgi:NAD-dependent SIR2 family protein deacetylase
MAVAGKKPVRRRSRMTMEIQRATTGNIRSLLFDGSQPTLLLGAGASVTSGIPAAEDTAEKAVRWAWCHAQGRSPEDMKVLSSDYFPWLGKQIWYSKDKTLAEQYPQVIGKLLGVKKIRRDFFEKLIAPPGIQPSVGYRSLARILHEGYISTVLTTNFDYCLDHARILENKPHYLVSIKTADDLVQFSSSPKHPQLIYLHGSVQHYSDKNLADEIGSLESRLIERLMPVVRDHPIVVVGYRGAEASIMRSLFINQVEAANHFTHGVYWCVRETEIESPLSPMLQEFASKIGTNFQLVPIKGFDELFEKEIWNYLLADGETPTRRIGGYRSLEIPQDMRAVLGSKPSDLDENTLLSRLSQYAKRLGIRGSEVRDSKWLESEARKRNLITEEDEKPVPTMAGWLLFARSPRSRMPQALVRFRTKGPVQWLKGCFGEDAATEREADGDGIVVGEQEIGGNLWSQLDELTDLLSHVNRSFTLKGEISSTAYPFSPIAIKEALVNALVHRDYALDEPIIVGVEPGRIEVISPGGLIAEVKAQTEGKNIEGCHRQWSSWN